MSRLSHVDPTAHPEVAEAFRRTTESRGFVSNLLSMLAHSPEVQKAYSALGHQLRFHTQLTEIQRELVICATVREVAYGWAHHGPLLEQLGFSPGQMQDLKAGRVPDQLSLPDQALCAFAFAYGACTGVPGPVLEAFRAYFSDRQAIEVGMLVSFYLAAGALIIAFEPEIETAEQLQRELDWQKIRPGAGH